MDKIDLEELERLAKAATPGPWEAILTPGWDEFLHTIRGGNGAFLFDLHNARNGEANAAYIVAACNHAPELVARVRELEERIAELTQENSGHKRVIHILENKVLALKGKPIPMEPRLPTCDALCRPRYILQSNCSNAAKEAVLAHFNKRLEMLK